jgi:hypothetical protein
MFTIKHRNQTNLKAIILNQIYLKKALNFCDKTIIIGYEQRGCYRICRWNHIEVLWGLSARCKMSSSNQRCLDKLI